MSEVDRASADLETLAKATRELVTSRDPWALLSRLNRMLAGRVEFTRAAILLFEAGGERAQVALDAVQAYCTGEVDADAAAHDVPRKEQVDLAEGACNTTFGVSLHIAGRDACKRRC